MTREEMRQVVSMALILLEQREWEVRHAAENAYCSSCARPEDNYRDQREHHEGCPYVATMNKLKQVEKELTGPGEVG